MVRKMPENMKKQMSGISSHGYTQIALAAFSLSRFTFTSGWRQTQIGHNFWHRQYFAKITPLLLIQNRKVLTLVSFQVDLRAFKGSLGFGWLGIEFPPGNSRDGNSREIWDFCLSRFPGNWSGIPGKRSIMKFWHLLTIGYVDFHILPSWEIFSCNWVSS